MDRPFGFSALTLLKEATLHALGGHMVENVSNPWGSEESSARQSPSSGTEQLGWLLAEQFQASLEWIAANQATVNQQMRDRVAQLLVDSQHMTPTSAMGGVTNQIKAVGWRTQKMTPDADTEAYLNECVWVDGHHLSVGSYAAVNCPDLMPYWVSPPGHGQLTSAGPP